MTSDLRATVFEALNNAHDGGHVISRSSILEAVDLCTYCADLEEADLSAVARLVEEWWQKFDAQ